MNLEGKVAVVTGSGRGLGRGYARALAGAGAAVVVNDLDEPSVRTTVAEITAAGGRAAGVAAPVGPAATADLLTETAVREFGRLDVLVTNAGILRDRVLWKMTDDDFDAVIDVHLRGTFTCARAAAVRMREQGTGGRLILGARARPRRDHRERGGAGRRHGDDPDRPGVRRAAGRGRADRGAAARLAAPR
jgi:NAD(P)-dependent dehydrogenase (short-subunit alcohol dehydrogenase family)